MSFEPLTWSGFSEAFGVGNSGTSGAGFSELLYCVVNGEGGGCPADCRCGKRLEPGFGVPEAGDRGVGAQVEDRSEEEALEYPAVDVVCEAVIGDRVLPIVDAGPSALTALTGEPCFTRDQDVQLLRDYLAFWGAAVQVRPASGLELSRRRGFVYVQCGEEEQPHTSEIYFRSVPKQRRPVAAVCTRVVLPRREVPVNALGGGGRFVSSLRESGVLEFESLSETVSCELTRGGRAVPVADVPPSAFARMVEGVCYTRAEDVELLRGHVVMWGMGVEVRALSAHAVATDPGSVYVQCGAEVLPPCRGMNFRSAPVRRVPASAVVRRVVLNRMVARQSVGLEIATSGRLETAECWKHAVPEAFRSAIGDVAPTVGCVTSLLAVIDPAMEVASLVGYEAGGIVHLEKNRSGGLTKLRDVVNLLRGFPSHYVVGGHCKNLGEWNMPRCSDCRGGGGTMVLLPDEELVCCPRQSGDLRLPRMFEGVSLRRHFDGCVYEYLGATDPSYAAGHSTYVFPDAETSQVAQVRLHECPGDTGDALLVVQGRALEVCVPPDVSFSVVGHSYTHKGLDKPSVVLAKGRYVLRVHGVRGRLDHLVVVCKSRAGASRRRHITAMRDDSTVQTAFERVVGSDVTWINSPCVQSEQYAQALPLHTFKPVEHEEGYHVVTGSGSCRTVQGVFGSAVFATEQAEVGNMVVPAGGVLHIGRNVYTRQTTVSGTDWQAWVADDRLELRSGCAAVVDDGEGDLTASPSDSG